MTSKHYTQRHGKTTKEHQFLMHSNGMGRQEHLAHSERIGAVIKH